MASHLRRRVTLAATASLLAASPLIGIGAAAADSSYSITPVIGGLAAPRGIAFDGLGSMYISESGIAGDGPAGMTTTGRVDKYAWGRTSPSWSTTFNSIYVSEDPSAPPDVLGPAGLSAIGSGCMKHSHGKRMGCQVQMVTGESTPGVLAASDGAVNDPQAGHLFRLDGATGAATDLADVGSQMYTWTGQHTDLFPPDFPDANPYNVLVTKDPGGGAIRTFVVDAAANTVLEIMKGGTARIVAYIPNETAAPFRDATPTCVTQGPDGYLYVGTLHFVANLFMYGGDQSDVWRINPNASYPTAPQLWASGLTTLTACTFDRSGNFWGAEMFQGGLDATPPGDVVKIPFAHPSQHTRIGFGQLPVPGGIAQGPDGAMYVTVGSSAPGVSGGVMRIQ